MKKSKFFSPLLALFFICLCQYADAQDWRYINSYKGVDVYWRYRKEAYATKYICELKFENTNSYKVEVSFKARFICADGSETIDNGNLITVGANSSKGGQLAGLWWYPCDDGRAPAKGGYTDMDVKKAD